jgi:hypothetical protein
MKARFALVLAFTAFTTVTGCATDDGTPTGPDGGPGPGSDATTNTGQRVVMCNGKVISNAPSNCPHDDCDETSSSEVVKCTAYDSFIPGATAGACKAGATNSYALKFQKAGETNVFYEVVECTGGTARLHACAFGFQTTPDGYNGEPGYVCTN